MDLPSRLLSLLTCLALAGAASAAAPTLTLINPIDGEKEDTPTSVTYAKLQAAANEADPDGDTPIEFRFVSLNSGTLKKGLGANVNTNDRLGPGDTWTWTPDENAIGELSAFSVRAYADGDDSATPVVVPIDVAAVNDAPSFSASNVTVAEDSGAFSQAGWATSISAGPPDEVTPPTAQTTSFTITSTNPSLFSVAPALTNTGTLTFTPAPNENGTSTLSVRIQDSGGVANGGVNQSNIQTYTITVTAVEDN
ncbi:MAG: hypothetical protein EOP83_25810, partial [Verrucomicrobiaceae bacterium]